MQMVTPLGHWVEEVRQIYLLAVCQKSQEPGFWEVIDSFVLLAYAIRQRLLTIISLPELYIQIYSVSTNEKKISMNYGSYTKNWKPGELVRLDLILTMRNIYISSNLGQLTNFTSSSKSTSLKTSSSGTSLKWSEGLSQSTQE